MDERLGSAGGRERVAIVKPPDSPAPLQPIVYARHGRCLMGFKSPVRDRTLEEISIPNDHYESASKRWCGEGARQRASLPDSSPSSR